MTKIQKNVGTSFIKFSSWKLGSITSLMRLNYKNGILNIKRNTIQDIYNLTNLSFNCNVFRLINNKKSKSYE